MVTKLKSSKEDAFYFPSFFRMRQMDGIAL